MCNTTGVAPLFREFKKHLRKNKKRLAPLQLCGRLEDYLTKEFARVILKESGGSVFPIGNYGRANDKRRIDLVLVKGNLSKAVDKKSSKKESSNSYIYAVLEVKYVRNRHRTGFGNAGDETLTAFNSLSKQLKEKIEAEYAGYRVRLRSAKHVTYGVVLASFVCREEEVMATKANETAFIDKTTELAHDKFLSHNFKSPCLKPIYSRVRVTVLKGNFLVSLYAGLWRIKESAVYERLKSVAVGGG